MHRSKTIPVLILFIAFLAGPAYTGDPGPVRLIKTISIPDIKGRIDHMDIDPARERLFVAALGNNSLEVIDLAAGKRIKSIRGLKEPQGVLTIREQNQLFVTNGGDGAVKIYDAESLSLVKTISLSSDADNIRYDGQTGRVYIGYGEGAIAGIDSRGLKRVEDVSLPGHPEAFQADKGSGRMFVNVPSAGKIIVIDAARHSVLAEWPVQGTCNNFPMALDQAGKRLFVGCRRPAKIIVYDTEAGRQVSEFPVAGDVDDIFFYAARQQVYVSCGAGILQVFEKTGDGSYKLAGNITTGKGARTSLFAPEQSRLYVAVPSANSKQAEILVFSIQP